MKKILVLEDDSTLAMGLEFALKKENFECEITNTVKESIDAFKKESFDLAILDVMLPDGSGYDVCKEIRKTSDIPIIFLTACDEEVNVVLGLDIGGDDYITKPFRVNELISRIKAAIRRHKSSNSNKNNSIIKSKDIVIYPLETKVTKFEEELILTPIEYKLLNILIKNPLNTITREVILQKLWDIDGEFVDDNTLSVYIRRLREKLESNPSKPEYIVTIRGIGYKWNQKHD
ncbi:putative signal transduction response regulator [Gottschalkia purinilytica]|uniref:Putative signal transduction response regulator n=1 Tax=Gottschalkia purinilytica TaxID=1503 RepID=A0A0L0W806_GOTPU|nr:response regulator transcription factor [Gottschalkia purinilytica]KNF07674.1 putative signal transduction response regulator [Gottschalkia purinilytica]